MFLSHELLHSHPDEVYRNGSYTLSLFQCSRHRSVRDYMLESSDPIPDLESLLINNVGIIENMFDVLQNFLVKALIYVDAKYHKIDHTTGEIIDERYISFPSRAADTVVNVSSWLEHHVTMLNARIETFNERDSDLEFAGIV